MVLASRYYYGNISDSQLKIILDASKSPNTNNVYDAVAKLDGYNKIFPESLFNDKDKYDEILYKLFELIINSGSEVYEADKENDASLNASNYLKKDINYFRILSRKWRRELSPKSKEIFDSIQDK